jgi:hypothetical protein
MSFLNDLTSRVGGALSGAAAGSALGPIGAIGGGILGAFGGGGGGGGGGGSEGAASSDASFAALYGAQAAQANAPLTIAGTRYGSALGSQAGALGLYGSGQNQANQNVLTSAINRAQLADQARANELIESTRGKFDLQEVATKGQYDLTDRALQAQIALNLLPANTAAAAANAALAADINTQQNILQTNLGLEALQESAKTNIAQNYAGYMNALGQTRATTEGNLATGAQRIAGDLALNKQRYDAQLASLDVGLIGDLTRNKAKTEADIARTRASADATKDLRRNAANIALTGQRYFG